MNFIEFCIKNRYYFFILLICIVLIIFNTQSNKEGLEGESTITDISENIYNMSNTQLNKYNQITTQLSNGKYKLEFPHTCLSLRKFKHLEKYADICKNTYNISGTKFCRMNPLNQCDYPLYTSST